MLPTDWGPPSTAGLSRVHDARAAQFWDKRHLLSKTLGGPAGMVKGNVVNDIAFDMGNVIWDFVAVYPPRSDRPSLTGAPVFKVIDEVRAQLSQPPENHR